jgi:hypothetical protein
VGGDIKLTGRDLNARLHEWLSLSVAINQVVH